MRKLLFSLFLLSCLTSSAGTVDVSYTFQDFTLHNLSVSKLTVTPLVKGADYSGADLSSKPLVYTASAYPTLTNGSFTVTNLLAGYAYRIEFSDGYFVPAVTNYFPSSMTGSVNGVTYKGVIISQSGGVLYQFAYYYQTNAVSVAAGTGITATTNGQLVTISAAGNGSGLTNLNASELRSGTVPTARIGYASDLATLYDLQLSTTTVGAGSGNLNLAPETSGDSVVITRGTLIGNGSGLTNLNAENIATGTNLLIAWTASGSYQPTNSHIDTFGMVYAADVRWPDNSAGTFTVTSTNTTYHVADSYTITHAGTALTVTQPTVSRDGTFGVVTNKPSLTVQ